MMHGKPIVLILGAVVFSVLGQLFLKAGARRLTQTGHLDFLMAAVQNWHVLAGLAAWAASTVCWLFVLRVAPLSRAYLATSLTYVLLPLASVYIFGEQVCRAHIVGTVLIITGIAFVLSGD
jgi:multidrug transporter EmrE-like cation transporter